MAPDDPDHDCRCTSHLSPWAPLHASAHHGALAPLPPRCISLTPTGKYDDLFLLQCCADYGAWALTNDAWREGRAARHATEAVRRRTIRFAFCGDAFSPAADDLALFDDRARRPYG